MSKTPYASTAHVYPDIRFEGQYIADIGYMSGGELVACDRLYAMGEAALIAAVEEHYDGVLITAETTQSGG